MWPPGALPGGQSDCALAARKIVVRDPDDALQHAGQSAAFCSAAARLRTKVSPLYAGFNYVPASVKSASHITKSTAARRRQPFATRLRSDAAIVFDCTRRARAIGQLELMRMRRFL